MRAVTQVPSSLPLLTNEECTRPFVLLCLNIRLLFLFSVSGLNFLLHVSCFILYACMYLYIGTWVEVKGQLTGISSGDQTQVIRLRDRHLELLSHFDDPHILYLG